MRFFNASLCGADDVFSAIGSLGGDVLGNCGFSAQDPRWTDFTLNSLPLRPVLGLNVYYRRVLVLCSQIVYL